MIRRISRILLFTTLMAATSVASADRHALLVGVSDYDDERIVDLKGPLNDVRAMEQVLVDRGFPRANIEVLADGVRGKPSKANIVAAFEALTDQVGPGDFVMVYFSGHGTQQPDLDGDESDGLDEVFMPIDVSRWSDKEEFLPNGLVDDELDDLLGDLERKGAQIWYVADHCFSGTVDKGPGSEIYARFTPPEALKIPPSSTVNTEVGPLERHQDREESRGDRVVFFASAPDQIAFEMPFPRDLKADNRTYHGELTYQLVRLLGEEPVVTYGELVSGLQAYYEKKNEERGRSNRERVDPMFAGYPDTDLVFE